MRGLDPDSHYAFRSKGNTTLAKVLKRRGYKRAGRHNYLVYYYEG